MSTRVVSPATITLGDLNLNTVDDAGVSWVFDTIDGWHDGPSVKVEQVDRIASHGQFGQSGHRGGRTVTVTGWVYADARGLVSQAVSRLAAVLADGEFSTFTFADDDDGAKTATVQLLDKPDVAWLQSNYARFQLQLLAPDPYKYGLTSTASTGFASSPSGSGLVFPLFGPSNLTTNYITDPSLEYGLGNFTGGAATKSSSTDRAYQGTKSLKVVTTGTGTGRFALSTFLADVTGFASVAAGVWVYVPSSNTGDDPYIRLGGTGVNETFSAGVTERDEWVRVTLTTTTTGGSGTAWLRLFSGSDTGDVAYYDLAAAMPGTTAAQFSGDTTSDSNYVYTWSGTPDSSTSVRTAKSSLDFGALATVGQATVTNFGNATSQVTFTVTGPGPSGGFAITDTTSGAKITYLGSLPAGSTLIFDGAAGSATVDGVADRLGDTIITAWPSIPAGATRSFLFEPLGGTSAATMTAATSATYW